MRITDVLGSIVCLVLILAVLRGLGLVPTFRRRRLMHIGKNEVVSADGYGRYIVQAVQADNIAGGVDFDLPANVTKVSGSLYMVDFTGCPPSLYSDHVWFKASGRINPRQINVLIDQAIGFDEHHYVERKRK